MTTPITHVKRELLSPPGAPAKKRAIFSTISDDGEVRMNPMFQRSVSYDDDYHHRASDPRSNFRVVDERTIPYAVITPTQRATAVANAAPPAQSQYFNTFPYRNGTNYDYSGGVEEEEEESQPEAQPHQRYDDDVIDIMAPEIRRPNDDEWFVSSTQPQ